MQRSEAENVLAGGGYSGKKFADKVKELLGCGVEIAKRNELHIFKVIPKRWVVERSFAWLEKCRRLWKNCERNLNFAEKGILGEYLSLDFFLKGKKRLGSFYFF